MKNKRIVIAIIAAFVSLAHIGCAPKRERVDLFFPPHPDEPRIAYVQSIRELFDIQDPSFFDTILGASGGMLFPKPYGVSAAGDKIYVTDQATNLLVILDMVKKSPQYVGSSSDVKMVIPIGVAAGDDGSIYVADVEQGVVLVFSANGEYKSVIGKKNEMSRPTGIAVNNRLGRVYISDTKADAISVYSPGGDRLFTFGQPGTEDGQLHHPTNIAIDRANDNVVVTDTSNFRVQVFDKDGKFLSKFGELGDAPGTFSRPKGVGVDSEGNIYVADAAFNNVQIFSSDGTLLTSIGSMGREPGNFILPAGLYVDQHDKIYVTDQMNGRIQIFQYMSTKWKKEHPEEYKNYLQRSAESGKKTASAPASGIEKQEQNKDAQTGTK